MSVIEDQAICIRRQDYSESSQIVTLFGREHGKIRGIGKGARREKGSFGGGIDLLTMGNLMFIPSRGDSGLATLTEFDLVEPFTRIRTDLIRLHSGQFAGDLIAQFTEDMDPHPDLYDAFVAFLGGLPDQSNVTLALVAFELALLRSVGFGTTWDRCCGCGQGLQGSRLYFSSSSGGMLCRECEAAVMEKRFIRHAAWQILCSPAHHHDASANDVFEAHQLLCYHLRELMGKETAIMLFLNRLLQPRIKGKA
ncbi:MAG: DNA repair protein RecO [Sedimentisphaerales bacterium]|nr:DNA repair protein RecO [Sedimentisphaerales bacterium]